MDAEALRRAIANIVTQAVSQETHIPQDQLREDEPLASYGVESVMSVSIARRLEATFGDLSKTLLFEYQTLAALIEYFVTEHAHRIATPDVVTVAAPTQATQTQPRLGPADGYSTERAAQTPWATAADQGTATSVPHGVNQAEIAIIGISGRFPQARNLEEFWENLSQGLDCISEVPGRLWDWRDYWHPDRGMEGKSYSKWGGFIEDADCFDPLFFNISNLEAEAMDPQERVFMETVHHTLEDAGYTRQGLQGKQIGLYVSVMWGSYQHYGTFDARTDSSFASIANRASYFFDFRGPSIALDTTCSGSLTALHLACESLRTGEVDLAVAGGVNITSHPHKYLALSRTGFASTDGRCRSFAADGNGYVPGDGVGALLLKPLAQAIADRDRIYAVIKSSAINHGGKSSGYTVPSAESQANLITTALQKAHINPRSITYVEAHAPGTALGDPIEIRGLTNAFRKYTGDTGFCAIGSVKSNIGHLESAAGFAGVAKVVLQMQHQQLVPSIHTEKLNPNIVFDTTPFYVQRTLAPWQMPVIEERGQHSRAPRRAAVSAFGAGGSNAHILFEEYVASAEQRTPNAEQLIVLSAKTEDRLRVVAQSLLHYVERRLDHPDPPTPPELQVPIAEQLLERISEVSRVRATLIDSEDRLHDLLAGPDMRDTLMTQLRNEFGIAVDVAMLNSCTIGDLLEKAMQRASSSKPDNAEESLMLLEQIAYTLQVGREAMQHRFATVVQSLPLLLQRLRSYLSGDTDLPQCWTGKVVHVAANIAVRAEEEDYVARLVSSRRYERLGRLWCNGVIIPWADLYSDPRPRRIALPLYPFARERCWVDRSAVRAAIERADRSALPSPSNLDGVSARPNHDRPNSRRVSADVGDLQRFVFRPAWSEVVTPSTDAPLEPGMDTPPKGQVLIYPRAASFLIDALKRLLPPGDLFEIVLSTRTEVLTHDTVYFLGGYYATDWQPGTKAAFDRLQAQSVLVLFRLAKALQGRQRAGGKMTRLKVVTNGACKVRANDHLQPYTAAVLGFTRAIAREYPHLLTEIIDLDLFTESVLLGELNAALHHVVDGLGAHREFAIRAGQPYVQQLQPYNLEEAPSPVFQENGVYVLIGGAGTVGARLSRYLAHAVSARMIWIGRRPCDATIKAQIAEIERLGGQLSYIAADARDVGQLEQAFDAVERECGGIDGVLHLAMVHEVTRIQDLSETQLRKILEGKTDSTYALYSVLRRHSVQFVALFSSAEAYIGNIGWSAYAAACSFQDAFALYWRQQAHYPVLAINWGYWEGIVPEAGNLLAAKGIYQLSVAQGAAILERALANGTTQLCALNVEDAVLERMGFVPRRVPVQDEGPTPQPVEQPLVSASANDADKALSTSAGGVVTTDEVLPTPEVVSEALIDLLASVLKIDKARFDVDVDLVSYGIDSLTVVSMHKTLENKVGSLPATLFITFQTIRAVAKHLLEQYPASARALVGLLSTAPAGATRPSQNDSVAAWRAGNSDVKLLRRLEPTEITHYLEQYGMLYRDGQLEQAALRATASTHSLDAITGRELQHLLVKTPNCESVELFVTGTGVPVLLLPAVGLTAPTWRYQITSTLAQTMCLCVPHPPGYGLTKPIPDCTSRGVAGVFKDVIDLVAPGRPVHLVASCLGCIAAVYLARFYPERIASLTLVGAFHNTTDMLVGDPDQLTMDEMTHLLESAVERIKSDFAGVTAPGAHAQNGASARKEVLLEFLLQSLCANSLIAMRYLSEMLTLSVLDWLSGIQVPTQCIYGTQDRIVSPNHSRTMAEAIPGAALVAIEGAGHFPYLTQSEQFNSLVERFVWQHERASRQTLSAPSLM